MAWRDLVIAGSQSQIDQLLGEIERTLPKEWARNTDAERRPLMANGPLSRSRCYIRHLQSCDVRLWLLRRSDYRLDGGLVEPDKPVRYQEGIAESILDFRQHALEPAIKTCGLRISHNHLGPLSLVPNTVMEALWAFYDSSQFRWPPTGAAALKWRAFVISSYQNHAAFDGNELHRWLVEKGWEASEAEELFRQLLTDAALLSEYDELRQPV